MTITLSRIVAVVLSYLLAYFLAWYIGSIYAFIFPRSLGGGGIISVTAMEWIVGLPLAVIFLSILALNAIGGYKKWWWIVISLLPVILLEIIYDPLHIYFPIILALIAWGLGTLAHKTLQKFAPAFMAKIT